MDRSTAYDRKLTILVVDDDGLVLYGIADLLTDLGHTAVIAGSGRDALDEYSQSPVFDLVITDHTMPGMTGIELARELHAMDPELPIILASGHSDISDAVGDDIAFRLGKPFNEKLLQKAIRAVMEPQ